MVTVTFDASKLSDIVSEINVSKNGNAFVIDAQGRFIGHPDHTLVTSETNYIKDSSHSAGKSLAKILIGSPIDEPTHFAILAPT